MELQLDIQSLIAKYEAELTKATTRAIMAEATADALEKKVNELQETVLNLEAPQPETKGASDE